MEADKPIQFQRQRREGDAPPLPRQSALVAFGELMRLVEGSSAVRDTNDEFVAPEQADPILRGVMARYGFERSPATWGEMFALFEYCDSLDAASGVGMRPPEELAAWRESSFVVWRRKSPHMMPAIELYCAGDIDALRELHRRDDTLTELGKRYLQNDEE